MSVTKVSFNANKFLPFETEVDKVRRVIFVLQNWVSVSTIILQGAFHSKNYRDNVD